MRTSALHALGTLTRGIDVAAGVACVLILVVIFALNTLEIGARTLFDHSFAWIYEINLLLGAWLYFLGIVPVYERGGDITLLGYERLLAGRARRLYRGGLEVTTALTFGVLAWFAWTLIELQMPFRSPGMHIPNPLFTLPVFLGLIGLALVGLRRAFLPQVPERPIEARH